MTPKRYTLDETNTNDPETPETEEDRKIAEAREQMLLSLENLINACTQTTPSARPNAEEIQKQLTDMLAVLLKAEAKARALAVAKATAVAVVKEQP